ncbi:glycoside hydrolase family 20 protein [Flavisolibacter ginsenosidimutans]|uniref:beta-N-acetylhexosaminidase n=1 Tax=Flavisolibacter ginsenosidimutans TaxID=661481 RepID=A0A5B8UEA0_9BACT|nr:family 20 glycosylhydrolase [Flavisolibacter ginsenosidimutans]QEC54439.1 family 20 glycosylhydrolase [Flavisolibacter ginsenosidimutans]
MKKAGWLFLAMLPLTLFAQQVSIIPQPVSLQLNEGKFLLDKNTALVYNAANKDLKAAAGFFSSTIKNLSGISLPQNGKAKKIIQLRLAKTEGIGNEGYLLNVTPSSVLITANTKAGLVYAMQTLFQTLPAVRTNAALQISAMHVKDYPRFKWRGMHLDVSRHFFSPDLVKQYIDLMALYKFNTFHWHLTDDQGWRIEIKKYPKLTEVGAWRVDENNNVWGQRPQAKEGEAPTYGGYYTQEQIKDVVAYAAQRNITIVPELDVPGHSAAAIASYPFLSCTQQPQLPMTGGNYTGISSNLCPGNDSVFTFLQDVYSEVINLFPSKYIHVGGDEVDKTPWKLCPKCQARIKAEALKNEEELQSYFIKRMEKFIVSKHRKMIGWDEILEGGLAPEAMVMSWRGEAGGIAAAKMNHDVVMTPGNPVYFDHYQGDPATEPLAIGGFNTLKKVYDYEPLPKELTEAEAKYILGAQANLWAEYITTPSHVLYMVLPRMLALSEVVWSPKEARDWNGFNQRLQAHFKAFDQKELPYSKGNFKVEIKPSSQSGQLFITLSTEAYKGDVYYTTDGTQPSLQSRKYNEPIRIDSSLTLKAITVVDGKIMSVLPAQQSFEMHKAVGKNVSYTNPVSRYYMADGPNSLTDGVRGTTAVGKYWHGFSGKDLIATIDLGDEKNIHSVSLGCLQAYRDWIMMPQWVKFEASNDGQNFTELKTVQNNVSVNEQAATVNDFVADFPERKARFIRVTAKVLDALPKGHSGEGKPAWIFADEIVVN